MNKKERNIPFFTMHDFQHEVVSKKDENMVTLMLSEMILAQAYGYDTV